MIPLKWVTLGWVAVMALGFAFCLYDLYQPLAQLLFGAVVSRVLPAIAIYLWLLGLVCLRVAAQAWLARPAASP